MATEHLTTEKGEKLSPIGLFQRLITLQEVNYNPRLVKTLNLYLDMMDAKHEGRLTPEGVEKVELLNELINCYRRLYCEVPEPNPEQKQSLENRIKELSI